MVSDIWSYDHGSSIWSYGHGFHYILPIYHDMTEILKTSYFMKYCMTWDELTMTKMLVYSNSDKAFNIKL